MYGAKYVHICRVYVWRLDACAVHGGIHMWCAGIYSMWLGCMLWYVCCMFPLQEFLCCFHVHAFDFVLADTLVHAGISHTVLMNPWKRSLCCTLLISCLSDLEVFIKSTSILTPAQYNDPGLSEGIWAKQIWLSFFSNAWVALGREAGQSSVQSS